jgi:hypothetical protein
MVSFKSHTWLLLSVLACKMSSQICLILSQNADAKPLAVL